LAGSRINIGTYLLDDGFVGKLIELYGIWIYAQTCVRQMCY